VSSIKTTGMVAAAGERMTASSTEPASKRQGSRLPGGGQVRIEFIHLLRAIAAILVVWAHLGPFFLARAERGWLPLNVWRSYVADPLHAYQDLGHFAVVVFFLVSGYIITFASLRESRRAFVIKRTLRIFPLLAVALVIAAGCAALGQNLGLMNIPGLEGDGISSYIATMLLSNWWTGQPFVITVTWTLQIEVMFYILALVLLKQSRQDALRSTWMMFGMWLGFSMLCLGAPWDWHLVPHSIYVAFLIIGRVAFLIQDGRIAVERAAPLLFAAIVAFILLHTRAWPGHLFEKGYEPLASYAMALAVFWALMQVTIRSLPRVLRFAGDISYSIYLLHMPVGMFTLALLHKSEVPFTLAFTIAIGIVVGASALTYRLVEQPGQRLARHLVGRGEHRTRVL